ncbi:small integral membrane protein 26 isoform X1 [Pithys albifrons albifrons]|uniref:small integral membrane protein 26 isoform X1 n=1 Tax=Pithys albifrons albifrons TaxID=3385563 RepID=UPI003A5CB413
MRAALWNARAALLYSVGGWTALGGMIYYSRESSGGGAESGGGAVAALVRKSELYESSEHCVGALRMSSECLAPDYHWKIVHCIAEPTSLSWRPLCRTCKPSYVLESLLLLVRISELLNMNWVHPGVL